MSRMVYLEIKWGGALIAVFKDSTSEENIHYLVFHEDNNKIPVSEGFVKPGETINRFIKIDSPGYHYIKLDVAKVMR